MHPRIKAMRNAEAAASVDVAADKLAALFGVTVEEGGVPTRDPGIKQIFASERVAAALNGVLDMTDVLTARNDLAIDRITAALEILGGAITQNDDSNPAMRGAWYLEQVAAYLERAAGIEEVSGEDVAGEEDVTADAGEPGAEELEEPEAPKGKKKVK